MQMPRHWRPSNMFIGLTQLKSLSIDVQSQVSVSHPCFETRIAVFKGCSVGPS